MSTFKQFAVAEANTISISDEEYNPGYNALINQFNRLVKQIKINIRKINKNKGNTMNIENGNQTKMDLERQCQHLTNIADRLIVNQKQKSYSFMTDPRINNNVAVKNEEAGVLNKKNAAIRKFDARAIRFFEKMYIEKFKEDIATLKRTLYEAPHNQKVIKTKKKLKKLLNNIQEDQHLIPSEKEALGSFITTIIHNYDANQNIPGKKRWGQLHFYMENGDVKQAAEEWEKLNNSQSETTNMQLRNKYKAWLMDQQDQSKIRFARLDKDRRHWKLTETHKYKHVNGVIMEKPPNIPYLKGDPVFNKINIILNSPENLDIKLKGYIKTLDSLGTPYIFEPEYNESNYIYVIPYLNEHDQKPWSDWRQFFDLKISQDPITITWVRRKLSLEERALEKSLSTNCLESFLNQNIGSDINTELQQYFYDQNIGWQTWRDIFISGDKNILYKSMKKTRERLQTIKQQMGSASIKNSEYRFTDTEAAELILSAIKHFKYTQVQSLFAREVTVVNYLNKLG